MTPTVKVPSGTVRATHHHPTYGYCVVSCIVVGTPYAEIRTDHGTAIVPRSSLERLKCD